MPLLRPRGRHLGRWPTSWALAVDALRAIPAERGRKRRYLIALRSTVGKITAMVCSCRKKDDQKRKSQYVYIRPEAFVFAFTFQDIQPPWRSAVNIIPLVRLHSVLLAYIMRHCIEVWVLRNSPAVQMTYRLLDVRRRDQWEKFRRLNSGE